MSAAYHEAAITEAQQAWRVPFWDHVATLRQQRQERLVSMLARPVSRICYTLYNHATMVCFNPSDLLTEENRPFLPTDKASLFKCLAAGYEAACEKLLDVDFRP